ncbi:hypothetical protein FEE95_15105 [Maribacter algarum]|uniref:Uncharacterized protein n=1 Tax=Maribacter algarum (ex Zhang et al. 2020) TaxID=2578118 RepID=A0A5S3PN93_9FLAO|nr:hypothetical protein [Maribacter algarum]TMM55969.1 hypothetical protein FEE95_15105 [Maribacter algarum]
MSKSCTCKKYSALKLTRDEISIRIKDSRKIKKHLIIKSKSDKGHHLYVCEICQQLWQLSSAWNWGGKDYLFKIPEIEIEDWNLEPFISPADLVIFSASMESYFEKNKLVDSENDCKREECDKKAILKDVLCKTHFIESLQRFGLLPKSPDGKIFEPYTYNVK